MVRRKSIPLCILLSIVTCGIYGFYWVACLANDTNRFPATKGTLLAAWLCCLAS